MPITNFDAISISIIIPMLNEETNLPALYESISSQLLAPQIRVSELIAVDNGSSDNSVRISEQHCTHVFRRPDDSIADLRNFGARYSTGKILIFMDADCLLGNDVISSVVCLLEAGNVAAVGPDGLIPIAGGTWLQNTWYRHTQVLGTPEQSIEVDNLSSGFFAIKSEAFAKAGGFNGSLNIGEDTDISRRLRAIGFRLIRSNHLKVYNRGHPETIYKFVKREYWHGDSLKHLLIHGHIEPLTIYLMTNTVAVMGLVVLLSKRSFPAAFALLAALCAIPFLKALKKARRFNAEIFRFFIVYLLYVNSRSAALFKISR